MVLSWDGYLKSSKKPKPKKTKTKINMKLWIKDFTDKQIEKFKVGNDREIDMHCKK
jgi:hypothetical protein